MMCNVFSRLNFSPIISECYLANILYELKIFKAKMCFGNEFALLLIFLFKFNKRKLFYCVIDIEKSIKVDNLPFNSLIFWVNVINIIFPYMFINTIENETPCGNWMETMENKSDKKEMRHAVFPWEDKKMCDVFITIVCFEEKKNKENQRKCFSCCFTLLWEKEKKSWKRKRTDYSNVTFSLFRIQPPLTGMELLSPLPVALNCFGLISLEKFSHPPVRRQIR